MLASQGDNRSTLDAARRAEALAREAGDGEQARVELAHALSLQSQASTRLGDARAAMRLGRRRRSPTRPSSARRAAASPPTA